jgi:2-amino-4-hydroxy-6-hydroxymethyldihydropteridine diphosphokinase
VRHLAYVGLGSNLGDREHHLRGALARLDAGSSTVEGFSSVYETEPQGPVRDQPRFYNAAARLATDLGPQALLRLCLEVETEMGRHRGAVKGPRTIDLDLLLFDDLVASWPELVLPHPELARRAFVLAPLLEIAPDLSDPRSGTALGPVLTELSRTQDVRRV